LTRGIFIVPDEHHATATFMSVNIQTAAVCLYLWPRCPIFWHSVHLFYEPVVLEQTKMTTMTMRSRQPTVQLEPQRSSVQQVMEMHIKDHTQTNTHTDRVRHI